MPPSNGAAAPQPSVDLSEPCVHRDDCETSSRSSSSAMKAASASSCTADEGFFLVSIRSEPTWWAPAPALRAQVRVRVRVRVRVGADLVDAVQLAQPRVLQLDVARARRGQQRPLLQARLGRRAESAASPPLARKLRRAAEATASSHTAGAELRVAWERPEPLEPPGKQMGRRPRTGRAALAKPSQRARPATEAS